MMFCNWLFKILIVRKFQNVFWKHFNLIFKSISIVNYRLKIDFSRTKSHLESSSLWCNLGVENQFLLVLHRNFDSAKYPEDAIQIDSPDPQSLTSSSPQACFLHWGLHQKPQSCIGEQERRIEYFDFSIKILILRNVHDVFQNWFISTFNGICLNYYMLNFWVCPKESSIGVWFGKS